MIDPDAPAVHLFAAQVAPAVLLLPYCGVVFRGKLRMLTPWIPGAICALLLTFPAGVPLAPGTSLPGDPVAVLLLGLELYLTSLLRVPRPPCPLVLALVLTLPLRRPCQRAHLLLHQARYPAGSSVVTWSTPCRAAFAHHARVSGVQAPARAP